MAEEDEVMDGDIFSKRIKILAKSQNFINLFKSN